MERDADRSDPTTRRIDPLDRDSLECRLREAALAVLPGRIVDDQELRHLVRVVVECSLLLTDVYSDERIARIMHPDRTVLSGVVRSLLEQAASGEGEVFYRIRRLPDDVRVVGDKALFDLALLGRRSVKGLALDDLGARAYRAAGEALELLAEDRRLQEFFRQNRLLMLPLEEEVTFLRRCSERFGDYTNILQRIQTASAAHELSGDPQSVRVPLMDAAADALAPERAIEVRPTDDPDGGEVDYVEAARGDAGTGSLLSRDELLSAYERMVLFSSLRMDRIRDALGRIVIDQSAAVEALCDEFSLFASGTRDLSKPPAYFLVGPTGVGKNHLVESLCRLLEGVWQVEVPALTIEGPSYTYPSDINELRGATRGFIRSDEDGILTEFHERSSRAPFSVILVDEVEKAHPQLRTFFLSILDRGTTTDNRGRILNFANSMIFFTSNLGYSDAQQRSSPIGYVEDDARVRSSDSDVRRDLRRELSPEFLNRVRMIHFDRLTRASAERILDLELERIARRYRDVHGIELLLAPGAREEILRTGFSADFGARHLAKQLESICNVEIAKRIRRDDRRATEDRSALVDWLRDLRAGTRPFDVREVRMRVLDLVRARLDYDAVEVVFEDGVFSLVTRRLGDLS